MELGSLKICCDGMAKALNKGLFKLQTEIDKGMWGDIYGNESKIEHDVSILTVDINFPKGTKINHCCFCRPKAIQQLDKENSLLKDVAMALDKYNKTSDRDDYEFLLECLATYKESTDK